MRKKMLLFGGAVLAVSVSFGQKVQEQVRWNSDEEKMQWIKEHPEEYKKMNGEEVKAPAAPVEFKTDAEKSAYLRANGLGNEIVILEDIPGFPKFIDTGNPEMDQADYAYRKDLWVEQNRELFDSLTKSPEENMTREERLQKGEIIIRN